MQIWCNGFLKECWEIFFFFLMSNEMNATFFKREKKIAKDTSFWHAPIAFRHGHENYFYELFHSSDGWIRIYMFFVSSTMVWCNRNLPLSNIKDASSIPILSLLLSVMMDNTYLIKDTVVESHFHGHVPYLNFFPWLLMHIKRIPAWTDFDHFLWFVFKRKINRKNGFVTLFYDPRISKKFQLVSSTKLKNRVVCTACFKFLWRFCNC